MSDRNLTALFLAVMVTVSVLSGAAVTTVAAGNTSGNETVQLTVSADPANASVGEEVQFTVTNETGSPVAATLTVNGTTYQTGTDGTWSTSFDTAGDYTVRADRANTSNTTYAADEVTVSVAKQTVPLVVEQTPAEDVTAGEAVKFSVYTQAGEPVSNVTLSIAGGTVQTGTDNVGSYTFSDAGDYTVEATASDTATTNYTTGTESVNVVQKVHNLKLSLQSSTPIRPGETVTFKVKNGTSSSGAVGAYLYVDGTKVSVNDDGIGTYTFQSEGTFTVWTDKPATDTASYDEDSMTIDVKKKSVNLGITRVPDSATHPGVPTNFTVKYSGNGSVAPGVTLHVNGTTYTTNENGVATVTFQSEGTYSLWASEEETMTTEYTSENYSLTVQRQVVSTKVVMVPDSTPIPPNSTVEFRVKNADSGGSVPNSTILVNGTAYETGPDGHANVTFHEEGVYTLQSYKENTITYEWTNDTKTVTVSDGVAPKYVSLSFEGKHTGHATVNGTATANLTLSSAPNGLAGFTVELHIADNSTARFNESLSAVAIDGISTANVTDNGTTLVLKAADLNKTVQDGATNVVLAQVGFTGEAAGSTHVSVEIVKLQNESGDAIESLPNGARLSVSKLPAFGEAGAPTNTDADPAFEDIDGDGKTSYNDVVTLFQHFDSDTVQSNSRAFDYKNDGEVDFADVVKLYNEASV